ncbi:bifunctional riboflavin kinase/FAD synthetase [Salinicola sp. JS01]|uniref:bifunctional riboflavin kinase/FAD synthetase n=1 Tax=Salinicola sp. JS01 TaxID=3050071 RepID=UPI00255B9DFE|nr:bifunctional riboflavin kinase/FAD synthetase [Salinicola sp. JS01]WIX33168.1 bifunctional riboflavin kinase/FAD synthetase [Salinicola sp. JS01]
MELIRGLHNLPAGGATRSGAPRECVATIGNFDGVHRGHQAILEQLKSLSRSAGLPVTVVIFEPQPREYFAGDQAPPRLTRLRDKVELLAAHGADRILCLPFNDALRSLTARQFIERVLIDGLRVRHLVVGDDFRFGCDRAGDFALLEAVGRERGFAVEHTRTFTLDDERVSSTRVRTLLASGNFCQAARMLGRPFAFQGRVVRDRQLGRTIGVPTANIPLTRWPLALRGVFACATRLPDGSWAPSVANIGWRPTVGAHQPMLEVHVLDRQLDLYGESLSVVPCARLRGETKFADFDTLVTQIHHDLDQARRYFQAPDAAPASDQAPQTAPAIQAPAAPDALQTATTENPGDRVSVSGGLASLAPPPARFPLASAPLPHETAAADSPPGPSRDTRTDE